MNTIGQKRVWRCHRCQTIAGPTTSFQSTQAAGELGTDWQKFYSFAEYKLHCELIHGEFGADLAKMKSDCQCFGGNWG